MKEAAGESGPFLKLGLTGWPLTFSLSPPIHEAALKQNGLRGEYKLYPVEPGPRLEAGLRKLVERVRSGDLAGLNVTIPHKEVMPPLLDGLTPLAEEIGAVNTLFLEGGRVLGDNTDADGFMADLLRWSRELGRVWDADVDVLMLGAGGASRAAAFALCRAGWDVVLAARRVEQAEELVRWLGERHLPGSARATVLDADGLRRETPDLVVNTTPLGMGTMAGQSPWPAGLAFPARAAVYDMIYYPRETLLVRQAREAGLPATGGLGMLIEQGALAFTRWTGCPVDRRDLWQACGY
ncbi:MAG: shikimate dehydrogenase [Kiritimatiellia bacterium]